MAAQTADLAISPSCFGVWDRGDAVEDFREFPFVRGTCCNAPWNRVEAKPGVFDWTQLDRLVEKAFRENVSLYVAFEAGPESPDWVYEAGVPKVVTKLGKRSGGDEWPHYPFYLAPEYKEHYHRFLKAVAEHLLSYPKAKRDCIAFIQVKTGCTGDECPYKGEPTDAAFDLDVKGPAWNKFRLETFALYAELFGPESGLNISLLFNGLAPEDDEDEGQDEGNALQAELWQWATTTLKNGFGIKNGALCRGHHLHGERGATSTYLPYLVAPSGLTLFRRSEMDRTWTRPYYQLNVPLHFFWGVVNALNAGQSIMDVSKEAMLVCKEQGFDYAFQFFTRYASQIHPALATEAFCALHKGLDCADFEVYPEDKFGKARARKRSVERSKAIVAEYAKYGAAIDDEEALTYGQVWQRGNQAGFNDVGWEIWPENYSRFLTQIEPDATSIPRWRIGGPLTATSPIYSRFGRGFEHATGKDALYLKLHEGFSADSSPKVMSITVVWYDAHEGSQWRLEYDAGAPSMKTALTVTGTGDQTWHHEVVTLRDAVFRQGGPKGADLALVNADDKDDIFSLVEVHRGEPLVPVLRPPAEIGVFSGHARGAKYGSRSEMDK